MNPTKNTQITMPSQFSSVSHGLSVFLTIVTLLGTLSCSSTVQPTSELDIDPVLLQTTFNSPEEAANTFAEAVKNNDQELFNKLLGADFREILPLDNVFPEDLDNFNNAWKKHHTLLPQGDKKMLLAIGEKGWTMPIPIVSGESGWHFDVAEGLERMRIRRIGRNELATMQAVLAYYDAQMEYSEQDRNGDGILEYAQKFISTPGTHDGLYWDAEEDILSPLGKMFADKAPGGGYHGYFYRILNAQGAHAKGGAYSYMLSNNMRSGFALIAWPEEYGESGVMSFLVNHDGIVYQQNLGQDSTNIAKKMSTYDPDANWLAVQEVNAPKTGTDK